MRLRGAWTMEVRNCRGCGRLFNYMSGAPICDQCRRKLEEKFQEVKEYLRDNPNSTVAQVSEAMDVSTKQIKQWIKEERLSLTTAGADGIVCEQCGAPICSGRFCNKCKASMVNNLEGAIDKPKGTMAHNIKEQNAHRMHFLQ